MKRNRSHVLTALIAALIFFMSGGCVSTGPVKYYTLSAVGTAEADRTEPGLTIEVGPVEIPDYIDRPHLVTRTSQNELRISDFHKWGGALKDDIVRVTVENLTALLSTDSVYAYPRAQSSPVQYQVRIKVSRFEGTPGERLTLKASWSIYGERGKELLMKSTSALHEETGSRSYSALVAAMSRAVGKLSSEIAEAVRELK